MMQFFSFAVLYLFLKSAHSLCPDPEYVEPCECFSSARIIRCNNLDKDITFSDSSQFKDMYVYFVIHNYKGNTLDLKGLQQIKFQRLFIENSTLKSIISSNTEKFSYVTNALVIRNNVNLVFDDDFQNAIGLFDQIVTLSVENNTMLRDFSFGLSPTFPNLNQVILQNNKLTSFNFNSIKSIQSLQQINLDHNAITDVNIDLTSFDRKLVITVNYNAVSNLKIVQTAGDKQSSVSIYLENNKLTKLEENNLFYFISQRNNHLYLRNNLFECTCDYTTTLWIVAYDLQRNIHDMTCTNQNKRNIFEVGYIYCQNSSSPKPIIEPTTQENEFTTKEIEQTTQKYEPTTEETMTTTLENEPTTQENETITVRTENNLTTAVNEPNTQTDGHENTTCALDCGNDGQCIKNGSGDYCLCNDGRTNDKCGKK